jgi:hypothetical protein
LVVLFFGHVFWFFLCFLFFSHPMTLSVFSSYIHPGPPLSLFLFPPRFSVFGFYLWFPVCEVLVFCWDEDTKTPTMVRLLVMGFNLNTRGVSLVEGDRIGLGIVADHLVYILHGLR